MKQRVFSILVIASLLLSLLALVSPAKASETFPSPDADRDGLPNDLETGGWYNMAGGPFVTYPGDIDSDNDGLTDGEEKLFDTNPLDTHNPGIAVRYDSSFNTFQYFSTTNPAYLSIKQGGDQYLMTEALVVRRGNTINITGPASATLTLTGLPGMAAMTAITPVRDPARGGWTITIPTAGTVGTYTATLTDGTWTKSMPVYVIFELPTDLPQDQIDAFLYDGDPANKRDEVAVWFRVGNWNYYGDNRETVQPCPGTNPNEPCSLWPYHLAFGMAQAYWTEQFTKSAFVNHAIKAIHGKSKQIDAVNAIAPWVDTELYTHAGTYQNSWSGSIYRYFDGTGWTMAGGDCETTATTFTTVLRSAGIVARPFIVDYVKTAGHGDPTWLVSSSFEYDHSAMIWLNGQWYAERAYSGDELGVHKYYPFTGGVSGLQTFSTVGKSGGDWYYNDEYGNLLVSVNEHWDFQNGSNGGGTVNTVWPVVTSSEFAFVNRDYEWYSRRPLEIMQSPDIDIFNTQNWFGDNWANTEWRTPVVSNPASPARDETLTYVLPVGVPDPATPLENFPYNPQVTSCSAATTTAECNAFKASQNLINLYLTPSLGGTMSASPALSSYPAGSPVVITAAPASGYTFGAWTGACAGQANPCTLTMSTSRTVSATFTNNGGSSANNETLSLLAMDESTKNLQSSSGQQVVDSSQFILSGTDSQTNQAVQFGKILKDYGVDTDQNGKFDQLVIEVEVTSTLKGEYQLSGQLLAGEKTFRGGSLITLDLGKQTVTLSFEGLPIGNNQAKGPYEVQALWIAEKDQPVGPYYMPMVMEAFQTFTYKTARYKETEFEITAAQFANTFSHQGVDKNRNGKYEAITVDVGLNIAVPGAFLVEGDLFDAQDNYVSHASWTGNKNVASLQFDVAKSQPPYTLGNLQLISKKGGQNGPMVDSRTYKAYQITDMDGKIEGGAVEFAATETTDQPENKDGTISTLKVAAVEPTSGAFTITPVDTNGNGKYDILRVNVSVKSDATDTKGNYRIEALLEDQYGTEAAWAVSGGQPIVPNSTQTMTLDFDGKMLYDQLPLTGSRSYKLVAVKIFSGNLSSATLESEVKYAVTTPSYNRGQFEPSSPASSPALTVFQDDLENGTGQWILTEQNITGSNKIYNVNIGSAIGGTFTLTVDSKTTLPVAWNISYTNLKTALTNAGIAVTNVTGSGTLAAPWVITFPGVPGSVTMDKTGLIENLIGTGAVYNVNIGYSVGGTFTLTVDTKTTAALAWNITAANLKTELTNAGIPVTTVTGSGTLAAPWVITFIGIPSSVTMDKTSLIENLSGSGAVYNVNVGYNVGGTFTLTVDSKTTAPLAWNITAANLKTALTNAGIGVNTVTGSGTLAAPWVITFTTAPASVTMDKTALIEYLSGTGTIYNVKIGPAVWGTFTLTVDSKTTAPLVWNITAANLKTALTTAGIPASVVTGSGTADSPWVITFTTAPGSVTLDRTGLITYVLSTITYSGNIGYAVGGTFTLTVDSKTTAPLAFNITAANLLTAITNAGIGVKTVTGSGTLAVPWVITFAGISGPVTIDKTGLIENLSGSGAVYNVNVGNAVGGTFTLTVDSMTTAPLAWNITATNLLTALTNAGIGVNTVTGSGTLAAPWVITFTAAPASVTIDRTGFIKDIIGASTTFNVNVGLAVGGTFTLTVDSKTTAPLAWNITAANLKTALTNAGIATGTVSGSGTAATPWVITFTGIPGSISIDKTGLITGSIWSSDASVTGAGTIYSVNIGPAVAGTFTLTVDSKTTVPNDWNITAANLKTALTNAGIAVSTVTGSGTIASPWVITFTTAPASVTMDKTGLVELSHSGSNAWRASTTVNNVTQQLVTATPLNLADYASPVLRFQHAYQFGNANDKAIVEVSTDGSTWTPLKTFTGIYTTPDWITEEIDLNAYSKMPSVSLRFNAQRANTAGSLDWYVDDVTVYGWPAVKTATMTPPASIQEGVPATFTASYTSINTSLPITYTWSFGGQEFSTTSPTFDLVFTDAGDIPVTLTVANPYGTAETTQTVTVAPDSNNLVLTTLATPTKGGTVTRVPNQQTFTSGTTVTLTAVPSNGYTFSGWSGGGCSGSDPCTLTMNADTTVTASFTPIEYTLTFVYDGPGTVTKLPEQATYHFGDVVQLTAVPAATYGFSQWDGDLTGSANPASITIDGNKSITARFNQGYTLATDTIGSGTVTRYPDQATYMPGQQVTITAFPGTNWDFSSWSGGCTGSGPCVLTMDRSKFVTATFTPKQFTLDVIAMPVGGTTSLVSKNPDQATYSYGQRVTLTPNPQLGWYFTSWGRDLTGSINPGVITIDGNKTVYANFSNSYSFPAATVSPTGSGTVTKSPNATTYTYGTVVTITATPATGWVFDHWGDSCTGTVNPCVVTVDGSEAVTAYFINSAYPNKLTIDKTIGGTVTPNPTGGSYADGTIVTLTAAPATGYTFAEWNGDCAGQANPCSLTMDGSKTVSATFTPVTYTLTITYNPTEGGGTTTPASGVITYPYGTVVNVFANPAAGYKFDKWTGSCTGTTSCSLAMTANRAVTAYFIPVNHNLTIAVDPAIGGTTTPSVGTYPYPEGSVVNVTATPLDGYEFAEWSGACTGIGGCSVTMDQPKTVTAIFAKDLEYLTVDITGSGKVIQNPPPPYHHGDQVTLTADPDYNWEFSSWGSACAGQGNPCTLTMDADKTVSAPFVQNLCSLPQNLIGDTGTLREDFETLNGWTVSGSQTGYSATINTANYKVGNASVTLTPPTTYGYVRMIKTVNWNMSAPNERGNFRFWVYVHGTGEPTDFSITLSNNQQYSNTFVTYYNSSYKFRYRPGWNLVNLRASDWKVGSGSPSWNNPIVSIRIMVYGTSATTYSIDGLTSGANGIPAVILTVDDGHNSLWNQVYAYMEPKNVRGTGYIITNQVNTVDRVTWAQLQEIYATGWTIGNHSASHVNLTTLSLSGQEAELLGARDALYAHGMTNVNYVAYPYGYYNTNTLTAMADLGMRSGRTTLVFNNLSPLTNPFELAQRSVGTATTLDAVKAMVDTAKSRGETLVLLFHDISTTPTSSGWYPDRFRALVDYMVSQGIPIITMDDLYRLQSSAITVPRAIGGSCLYTPPQTQYTLTYTAGTGGTLTGVVSQTVPYGGDGTPVTAVANTGYQFTGWSDGSTANPRTDTGVTANVAVTANFIPDQFSLTVTSAHGTVSKSPDQTTYTYNTPVTLTMGEVEPGWTFTGWEGGGCTGTAPCIVTITSDTTVTANFEQSAYVLTVNSAHGTVTKDPDQTTYAYNTPVTLTMGTVDTGWKFTGWEGGGCTGTAPCTVNVTSATTVTANFSQTTYTVSFDAQGGTPVADQTVAYGGKVTEPTAPTKTGYTFAGWYNDTLAWDFATDTVSGALTLTAHWTANSYTISFNTDGGTPVPTDQTVAYGGKVTEPTAPTKTGYTFTGWYDGTAAWDFETDTVSGDLTLIAHWTTNSYTVTFDAQGGTPVPTDQTVAYGGKVTEPTAPTKTGYTFAGWYNDTLAWDFATDTVSGDLTLIAHWTTNSYTLTVNQSAGGTIAPVTASYDYGTIVDLTATPADGYHFVEWKDACAGQSGLFCHVTITDNLMVSATFELTPVCYALTLDHTGEGSNPVASPANSTGCAAGQYLEGQSINLSGASPADGYEISSWTGTTDNTSRASTNTLTMPAHVHSAAVNYTQIDYTLKVNSAHGLVDLSAAGPYHYGDTVILTMGTIDAGWTFNGWSASGCTGTGPCTVTIHGNTEVTANFTETEYALTITPSTGGTITANPGAPYHLNEVVTLTAAPDSGYSFSTWVGDCAGQDNPCTLEMNVARSVSATFTQNHYTLEVISAHGPVSRVPAQTDYTYNQTVVLTMGTVDAGWTFAGWSGDGCSGTDPCTVTITDNTTVTANFTQNEYSLQVGVDPADTGNTVTLSSNDPYHYNDPVAITAKPAAGWQFDHWGGDLTGSSNPASINITGNMVVTAYFTRIEYMLEMVASPSTGGSITPDKPSPYYLNDVVTLTATPAPGYTFTRWEGACSGIAGCAVEITANTSVTAVFTPIVYSLTVTKQGNGTVSADKQPPYYYGTVVTLTATADPGWTFTGWDGVCTGNGNCQVTMNDNRAVTATFTEDQYILDITINGSGTVIKNPDKLTYAYGEEVTLTAQPASGWDVSEWSVDGCSGNTCTVNMYGDQNVIVTFTQYIEYTLTTSVDPVGSGTIIADPGGPTYPRDTMVRLTVIPASGYFFDHWTGDCAGQGNPCTVTMNGDKTATAYLASGVILPMNLIATPGTPREGFESLSSWTVSGSGSGYGAVLDTVNVKEGTASIKLTTPASGNVTITKTVAWDLSADQGNIRFWVYNSGAAEPTGGSIVLYTSPSSYYTTSYGGAFKLRYKPGWNLITLRTSDWKATGSPSWANITSIRIRLDSRTANTYSFDELTSGVVSQPAVIFTFDKSLSSLYTQAFSYMSSHNVRGTGYVITDLPDTTGYARWDQLQAMKAAGWTIGNQTMSNVDLTTLDLAGQTAQLQGAMNALVSRGLDPCHVAYPGGKYNANTLNAMTNLGMCTGRTLMAFNNVSPLASPFEIAQRTIVKSTTLSTAQSWVDTAKARGEILVITIQGLSASPTTNDWYISRFQSLVSYCISQGIPIITMDDLYDLQSGDITIPAAK